MILKKYRSHNLTESSFRASSDKVGSCYCKYDCRNNWSEYLYDEQVTLLLFKTTLPPGWSYKNCNHFVNPFTAQNEYTRQNNNNQNIYVATKKNFMYCRLGNEWEEVLHNKVSRKYIPDSKIKALLLKIFQWDG